MPRFASSLTCSGEALGTERDTYIYTHGCQELQRIKSYGLPGRALERLSTRCVLAMLNLSTNNKCPHEGQRNVTSSRWSRVQE
jgi:hypothetical protein